MTDAPTTVASPTAASVARRVQVWRSPPTQPAWTRPVLLALTALAAFWYSWHSGGTIEEYYGAAVRSMASSWHDFWYAAFDPAGTVSVDKLPGALWLQALSVRLFGFHVWAILLPQVVAGALTVPVLFRAVRRLAGPVAGIVAAGVLAVSPATVTLDRGNIPDTLMILLLVLAADATAAAIEGGRWQPLAVAGVCVGLAFQTKMLEAWLVLPALAVAVVVAAPGPLLRRLVGVGALAVVTVVVSLAWMVAISVTPASQRPYVDGSNTDSVFSQVFEYNGFTRVGTPSPNQLLGRTLHTEAFTQAEPPPAWNRLVTANYGHDTGWLLPLALLAAPVLVVARRRRARGDPVRAAALLWGAWLYVLVVVFTVSTAMNSYYAGALSPAVAALLGVTGVTAWELRRDARAWAVAAAVIGLGTAYAVWLLPAHGTDDPSWLRPLVAVVGAAATVFLGAVAWRVRGEALGALGALGALAAGVALLLVPVVASASVVAGGLGAFDTPFQPPQDAEFVHLAFDPQTEPPGLTSIEAARNGAPDLMAAQTSALAALYIFHTGDEVLPLGGYDGTNPEPSVRSLAAMVAEGRFHLVLLASPSASPASAWVARHCPHLPSGKRKLLVSVYYCGGL